MQYHYFPSCNFTAAFPKQSTLVKKYVADRFNARIMGCCHVTKNDYPAEETAITICQSCALMIKEKYSSATQGNPDDFPAVFHRNLFELLAEDDAFPWPDLSGKSFILQDCFRASDKPEIHEAVRTCLRRMKATIRELPDNREKARYDGLFLLRPGAAGAVKDAPHYFHHVFPQYATPLSPDEQKEWLADYARSLPEGPIVCYCNTCTIALRQAGKEAYHLAELMFPAED